MKRIIYVALLASLFTACEKDKTDETGTPGRKTLTITESMLMNVSTSTKRIWLVSKITRKYYSAAGALDSTVTPAVGIPPTSVQKIQFSDNGVLDGKVYSVADTPPSGGVTLLIPTFGKWLLVGSSPNQTLTLSPSSFFPGGGAGGIFNIIFYEKDAGNVYAYRYNLEFNMTRNLTGGRKVEESFTVVTDF